MRLARVKRITYAATYEIRTRDGAPEEVIIAQKLPRSVYRRGDVQHVVDDGNKTVACLGGRCTEAPSQPGIFGPGVAIVFNSSHNPLVSSGIFRGDTPGAPATISTRVVAGQSSDCVTLKDTREDEQGTISETCMTSDGIFTFSDEGHGTVMTLTRYDTEVSDDLFTFPAVTTSTTP